jgi:hypothetical protein
MIIQSAHLRFFFLKTSGGAQTTGSSSDVFHVVHAFKLLSDREDLIGSLFISSVAVVVRTIRRHYS